VRILALRAALMPALEVEICRVGLNMNMNMHMNMQITLEWIHPCYQWIHACYNSHSSRVEYLVTVAWPV
jgi:hypothetical protein